MLRRQFLTGLTAPLILGAQNKSGSAKPVIGSGDHTYEVTHDWGELPAGIQYGNTHGVCEDSQGRIYIHHTVNAASESHDTMVVFDRNGKFVKSWGAEFRGGAHGLKIQREGNQEFLYLCDTKRAVVVKSTLDGEEVFMLGYPSMAEPYSHGYIKYSPTNLAIAPNGDIYIGDGYGSSYINQYNREGNYVRTFGGKGTELGKLDCPHGLIVDTRSGTPVLVVADRGNHRIQRFQLDGTPIDTIAGTNLPCHFNVFRNGDVVVPDLGARVTLLDRNNQVIEHLGDDSQSKWSDTRKLSRDHFTPGKFVCPHSACFDHAGNIFVVEWVEVGRVTKLRHVIA
ncbi:hypothetical protein [Nevskia soli]|uniref:hypothetical protein n=1 Tax=Nevskia soli TaxID=418856 RepID=UPI0015D8724E|nr:hypothetical protein [Nevskia soli]